MFPSLCLALPGALNRLQDQSFPPVRACLTPVASSCSSAEEESARGTTQMLRHSKVIDKLLGCVASRPLRAPYLPHPSAIFASRSLSSPSFRHWILEPLDLGFLVLLIFSSSDLLLPCVDVTDRPGYDRIFPSPPFGPRHLPVHCRLVSCTCTLLVIYTDPAAPFSHISQSSLEASTICLP